MGIEASRPPPVVATPTIVVTVASETDCDRGADEPATVEEDVSPVHSAAKDKPANGPVAALLSFNKATTHECKATVSAPSCNLVLESHLVDSPRRSGSPSREITSQQFSKSIDTVLPSNVTLSYSQEVESSIIMKESSNISPVDSVNIGSGLIKTPNPELHRVPGVLTEPARPSDDKPTEPVPDPADTTVESMDISNSSVPSIIIPASFEPVELAESIETVEPPLLVEPIPISNINFTASASSSPQAHTDVLSDIVTPSQDQTATEEHPIPTVPVLSSNVSPVSASIDFVLATSTNDSTPEHTEIPQAATYAEATNLAARYPKLASEILVSPLRRAHHADTDVVSEDQGYPKQEKEEITRAPRRHHRGQSKGNRRESQQNLVDRSKRRVQERPPQRPVRHEAIAATAPPPRAKADVVHAAPKVPIHTSDKPNWAVAPPPPATVERAPSLQTNRHGVAGRPPRRSHGHRGRGDRRESQDRARRDSGPTVDKRSRDVTPERPKKRAGPATAAPVQPSSTSQDNTRIPAPTRHNTNEARDAADQLPAAVRRASYTETSGQRTSNADALLTKLFRQAMDMDSGSKEPKRPSERHSNTTRIDKKMGPSAHLVAGEPSVAPPSSDHPQADPSVNSSRIPSTGFSFRAAPEQHAAMLNEFKPSVQLSLPSVPNSRTSNPTRKPRIMDQALQHNGYVDPFRPPMDTLAMHKASSDRLRALNRVLDRGSPDAAIDISTLSRNPAYRPESVMYANGAISASRPVDLERTMQSMAIASGRPVPRPFSGGAGQMGAPSLMEEQMFHRGGGVMRDVGPSGTGYGQHHTTLPPYPVGAQARSERKFRRQSSEMPMDRMSWSRY
ncbi:hypothetical protein BV22DRAFT_1124709 [Leucogyrophana mollusca]|uniref:Uncharacterized protein n=1 Tax=Leucogyrophana mollusca TaxID=85980 RepID=A0ACB8C142_9AGAM|nr:hypothetical protein BV22DRAFT_1124709 [Leucogyrophana mollusca]